jgi:hypothetical protein
MPIQKYFDEASQTWKAVDSGAINDGTIKFTPAQIKTFQDNTTAQLAENVKYSAQADFVKLISDRTDYKRMRIKKITSPYTAFSVVLDDGVNHVTHEWRKNTLDDFYVYLQAFAGNLKLSDYEVEESDERTGTFTTAAPNYYTTQVGATIKGYIKGSKINFNAMTDNRGGLWEFVVDGNTANPVQVSVWSSAFVALKAFTLFDGLDPSVVHTVVGTFKGDDPANAPSGGAGTARGWFRYDAAATESNKHTFNSYRLDNGSYLQNTMLLGYASNKEFAFSITKNAETHWFPEHNSQGTAFQVVPPRFVVDSVELDFSNMTANEYIEGNFVEIIQEVYCKLPNITGNIAKMRIVYTVNKKGVVALSGNFEVLQDCTIGNGYTMMFPLVEASLREVVTGIGTYKMNSADSSEFPFTQEKDSVFSFAGIDSRNPNFVAAMTIDYPLKTLRVNKSGRETDLSKFYYLWQRTTYPKLYPNVFKGHNAVTGEKYSFHGRYAVGKINGAYEIIKN